jgi:predicted nucleic acid-binding protein
MVVDASVVVSRLVPHDVLLLPEIAGAVARRTGAPRLAQRAVEAVLRLPALRLVVVDDVLARRAAILAGRLRLRGADAVYIATAATLRQPLVTWDAEQRDQAARVIQVMVPEE